VQECILNTLRESIPVESILKAYMDETVEEDVIEEIKEQYLEQPLPLSNSSNSNPNSNIHSTQQMDSKLSFNNIDYMRDENNNETKIEAPKNIERLEEISEMRAVQRRIDEADNNYESIKLNISDQSAVLGNLDVHNLNEPEINLLPDLLLDDIEVLE
jgi:hypothetical protein